jgi:metal-responsive CopG/Arc/MetJ family transcriptional regulator
MVAQVARKKKETGTTEQVNIRFPADMINRLDETASGLGIDRSGLVRMIVIEKLVEYERRAREARGEQ